MLCARAVSTSTGIGGIAPPGGPAAAPPPPFFCALAGGFEQLLSVAMTSSGRIATTARVTARRFRSHERRFSNTFSFLIDLPRLLLSLAIVIPEYFSTEQTFDLRKREPPGITRLHEIRLRFRQRGLRAEQIENCRGTFRVSRALHPIILGGDDDSDLREVHRSPRRAIAFVARGDQLRCGALRILANSGGGVAFGNGPRDRELALCAVPDRQRGRHTKLRSLRRRREKPRIVRAGRSAESDLRKV